MIEEDGSWRRKEFTVRVMVTLIMTTMVIMVILMVMVTMKRITMEVLNDGNGYGIRDDQGDNFRLLRDLAAGGNRTGPRRGEPLRHHCAIGM